MNLPNKLTIFRIFLIPIFLLVLLSEIIEDVSIRNYAATAVFILASATDALDGHIARSRNLITNFGKFMDPLADKMLVAAALIALVGLDKLNSVVTIIIISREFLVTGFRLVAAEKNVVIAADIWGKIKTVTQMAMIIVVLLDIEALYILKIVLITLSVFFTIISAVNYVLKNKEVMAEK